MSLLSDALPFFHHAHVAVYFLLISREDLIMIIFVSIALGRCWAGPVGRRTWLGLGGVMLVVAAGLAAYGLNSVFGEETVIITFGGGGGGLLSSV